MIHQYGMDSDDNSAIAFVGIDGDKGYSDPADALLAQLAGCGVQIKKATGCSTEGDGNIAHDKVTGVRGLLFSVGVIRWQSPTSAVVSGGYYGASLGAEDGLYYLTKENGQWKVIRYEMQSIS